MDVHVTSRGRKGVRVHEGELRFPLSLPVERFDADCVRQVLYEHDFPVPRPVDQARHCILMGFIDAYPL